LGSIIEIDKEICRIFNEGETNDGTKRPNVSQNTHTNIPLGTDDFENIPLNLSAQVAAPSTCIDAGFGQRHGLIAGQCLLAGIQKELDNGRGRDRII
jgi:hypothetical protein